MISVGLDAGVKRVFVYQYDYGTNSFDAGTPLAEIDAENEKLGGYWDMDRDEKFDIVTYKYAFDMDAHTVDFWIYLYKSTPSCLQKSAVYHYSGPTQDGICHGVPNYAWCLRFGLALADVNNDGYSDYVASLQATKPFTARLVTLINNHSGGVSIAPVEFAIPQISHIAPGPPAVLGDFEVYSNGQPSLLFLDYWDGGCQSFPVYYLQGKSTPPYFSAPVMKFSTDASRTASMIYAGHLDASIYQDVIYGFDDDGDPGQGWLRSGTAPSIFGSETPLFDMRPVSESECSGSLDGWGVLAVHDFNADGWGDIALCDMNAGQLSYITGPVDSQLDYTNRIYVAACYDRPLTGPGFNSCKEQTSDCGADSECCGIADGYPYDMLCSVNPPSTGHCCPLDQYWNGILQACVHGSLTVDAGGPYDVDVGASGTIFGVADSADGTISSLDWGMGSSGCTVSGISTGGFGTPSANIAAQISCPQVMETSISLSATDDSGLSAMDTAMVRVHMPGINAAPQVTVITPTSALENSQFDAIAQATDADGFISGISWSDPADCSVISTATAGIGTPTASSVRKYACATTGTKTMGFTADDDDSLSGYGENTTQIFPSGGLGFVVIVSADPVAYFADNIERGQTFVAKCFDMQTPPQEIACPENPIWGLSGFEHGAGQTWFDGADFLSFNPGTATSIVAQSNPLNASFSHQSDDAASSSGKVLADVSGVIGELAISAPAYSIDVSPSSSSLPYGGTEVFGVSCSIGGVPMSSCPDNFVQWSLQGGLAGFANETDPATAFNRSIQYNAPSADSAGQLNASIGIVNGVSAITVSAAGHATPVARIIVYSASSETVVPLDGSTSTADEANGYSIALYSWSLLVPDAGCSFTNPSAPLTDLVCTSPGTRTVILTVTDSGTPPFSGTDQEAVVFQELAPTSQPRGADQLMLSCPRLTPTNQTNVTLQCLNSSSGGACDSSAISLSGAPNSFAGSAGSIGFVYTVDTRIEGDYNLLASVEGVGSSGCKMARVGVGASSVPDVNPLLAIALAAVSLLVARTRTRRTPPG